MSEKKQIDPSDFPFLPIDEGNHLIATSLNSKQRKGRDDDDDYYDECTPDGEVVAKFHLWHHMSIYPPFGVSEGWAKFDLEGNKIASGSKQQ